MYTVCSGSLLVLLLRGWSVTCGRRSGALKVGRPASLMCAEEHVAIQTMKQSSCAAEDFLGPMLVDVC